MCSIVLIKNGPIKIHYLLFVLLYYTDHTSPLFKELAILPLDDINNETIALFMFRFFNSMLPSSFNDYFKLNKDVHKYNIRLSFNVHKTQIRTNYQNHSVKYKGNLIWNNLLKSFKEIIKNTWIIQENSKNLISPPKERRKHQSLILNKYHY